MIINLKHIIIFLIIGILLYLILGNCECGDGFMVSESMITSGNTSQEDFTALYNMFDEFDKEGGNIGDTNEDIYKNLAYADDSKNEDKYGPECKGEGDTKSCKGSIETTGSWTTKQPPRHSQYLPRSMRDPISVCARPLTYNDPRFIKTYIGKGNLEVGKERLEKLDKMANNQRKCLSGDLESDTEKIFSYRWDLESSYTNASGEVMNTEYKSCADKKTGRTANH